MTSLTIYIYKQDRDLPTESYYPYLSHSGISSSIPFVLFCCCPMTCLGQCLIHNRYSIHFVEWMKNEQKIHFAPGKPVCPMPLKGSLQGDSSKRAVQNGFLVKYSKLLLQKKR